jgi:hypothetical protein
MNPQLNYFSIPEENLGVLIDFEFKELHKIEREIKEDWIKNNRCDCVKNLRVGKVLRCEHIKKEKREKTKELQNIFFLIYFVVL